MTKYTDQFLKLNCAVELLKRKLFPNTKEITESIGCFNAVVAMLQGMSSCGRRDLNVIIVGDGSTPRTGALFAMRSAWNVLSIDPNFNQKVTLGNMIEGIERLSIFKGNAQETPEEMFPLVSEKDTVLVFPHSHAPTKRVLERFKVRGGAIRSVV